MKWTIANSSDLLNGKSWSARDIIGEKEAEGFCCHICNQVKVGQPHATFKDPGDSEKPLSACSEGCRQKMCDFGFEEYNA
jgi:hypothetical protein